MGTLGTLGTLRRLLVAAAAIALAAPVGASATGIGPPKSPPHDLVLTGTGNVQADFTLPWNATLDLATKVVRSGTYAGVLVQGLGDPYILAGELVVPGVGSVVLGGGGAVSLTAGRYRLTLLGDGPAEVVSRLYRTPRGLRVHAKAPFTGTATVVRQRVDRFARVPLDLSAGYRTFAAIHRARYPTPYVYAQESLCLEVRPLDCPNGSRYSDVGVTPGGYHYGDNVSSLQGTQGTPAPGSYYVVAQSWGVPAPTISDLFVLVVR
jgi:hypothetical protein